LTEDVINSTVEGSNMAKKSKKRDAPEVVDVGIECSFTGSAPSVELLAQDEDDDLFVAGWLRVTVERRTPNPVYLRMLQSKESVFQAAYAQVVGGAEAAGKTFSDQEKQEAAQMLRDNIDAQWFAALDAIDKFVVETEEVWVSDPASNKKVQEAWDEIGDALGVDLAVSADDSGGAS